MLCNAHIPATAFPHTAPTPVTPSVTRFPAAVQPRRVQLRERRLRRARSPSAHIVAHAGSGLQQFESSSSSNGRKDMLHVFQAAQKDSLANVAWDAAAEPQQPATAAGLQQYIQDRRPEAMGKEGLQGSTTATHNGGSPHSNGTQPTHSPAQSAAPSPDMPEPKYKTVMLKVSGEALMGPHGFGVDPQVLLAVSEEVAAATQAGVRIAIVVGGGNFFRGAASLEGLERATGDYVGMLATVMNALCLQSALEKVGVETRVQTAIEMREVAEPYIRRRAISHLQAGRVVIFGAGTGNPFFTTDTAAALRAAEVNAEVFLKATKVDGVYDSDPFKNPNARRYDQLSYRQVCFDSLNVMDETAITLCKENSIPVIVFNIMEKGNIRKAALGLPVGTVVDNNNNNNNNNNSPHPSQPQSTSEEEQGAGAQSHGSLANGAQSNGVNGASGAGLGASMPAFQQ